MKLVEPRKKRRITAVPCPPFPIQIESETGIPASRALWQVYTGIFNGDSVIVDDPDEMDILFNMGFFGKGSLSRGGPEFGKAKKGLPPFVRNRQWLRRKEWALEQEKMERAASNECDSKDQLLMDAGNINKGAEESLKNTKESVLREQSGDVSIITAGPSGNNFHGVGSEESKDSLQDDVVTLDVPVKNNVKRDSNLVDQICDVVKTSLKRVDVVTLSDDEAPKKRAKCLDSRDEIEIIDDNSSNDTVSKLADVLVLRQAESGVCKNLASPTSGKPVTNSKSEDEPDVVDVEATNVVPQTRNKDVCSTEEVIEILETSTDRDTPVIVGSGERNDRKESDASRGGGCTDLVTVQDDSGSFPDAGGEAAVPGNAEGGASESEESDVGAEDKRAKAGLEVLVLPDSDSEDEGHRSYTRDLRARLEPEQFPVRETLHLSLEEAYFLSYGLGCLQVLDPFGNLLSLADSWKVFREAQGDFVPKYVAYHYLRAKGWVVRSGLKYGGDFMLYKQGPLFYHASYVVIVEVLRADDWSRHPALNSRSFSWGSMATLNRVVTAAGKELLICQVVWPTGVPSGGPDSPSALPQFTVNEVLMKRWVASEEREKDVEGENWDNY